ILSLLHSARVAQPPGSPTRDAPPRVAVEVPPTVHLRLVPGPQPPPLLHLGPQPPGSPTRDALPCVGVEVPPAAHHDAPLPEPPLPRHESLPPAGFLAQQHHLAPQPSVAHLALPL